MADSSGELNPIECLAQEFLDRRGKGEEPTVEEYAARYPQLADEIRQTLPVLLMLNELGADSGSSGGSEQDEDSPGPCLPFDRLGDYRIIRWIGGGGMGNVYEAEQESLGCRRAVKVLKPGLAFAPDNVFVLRFYREARAAAVLHHSNIVPVFDVGHEDGHYYYAMQFIAGLGLDEVIKELKRLHDGGPTGVDQDLKQRGAGVAYLDPSAHAGIGSAHDLTKTQVISTILVGRAPDAVPLSWDDDSGTIVLAEDSGGHADAAARVEANGTVSSGVSPPLSSLALSSGTQNATFFRSAARVALQLAEALDYAHGKGFFHRDIKPSNILLDNHGNAWVTDFGLAKDMADRRDLTRYEDVVGTTRYVPPEYFSRSSKCDDCLRDVYAIGLTLYELIALRPAFDTPDLDDLVRQVRDTSPTPLRQLVPRVPRDLETIVSKASARDPNERYKTAEKLAEDLRRFLENRPIEARRPSLAEQAWRACKRYPVQIGLAAAFLLAIVAGLIGVSWQWRRAEANLLKTQQLSALALQANEAFTKGASEDVLLKEPQLKSLRKQLLGGQLEFYNKIEQLLSGESDRTSRTALADALDKAGQLHAMIDSPETALAIHRRSLAIRESLVAEHPGDDRARLELGNSLILIGDLFQSLGDVGHATEAYERARTICERLERRRADDDVLYALARCLQSEAKLLVAHTRQAEAFEKYQRALELCNRLVEGHPAAGGREQELRAEYQKLRAHCWYNIGDYWLVAGNLEGSLRSFKEEGDIREELAEFLPGDLGVQQDLARSFNRVGNALRRFSGRPDEAWSSLDRARQIYEELVKEYPSVVANQRGFAITLQELGALAPRRLGWAKARDYHQRSLEILEAIVRNKQSIPIDTYYIGYGLSEMGMADAALGQFDDAVKHSKDAVEIAKKLANEHGEIAPFQLFRGVFLCRLAMVLAVAGRPDAMDRTQAGAALVSSHHRLYPDSRETRTTLSAVKALMGVLKRKASAAERAAGNMDQAERLRQDAKANIDEAARLQDDLPFKINLDRFVQGVIDAHRFAQGDPRQIGLADRAIEEVRKAVDDGFTLLSLVPFGFDDVLGDLPAYRELLKDIKKSPAYPRPPGPQPDRGRAAEQSGGL